jgi:hypothetical protein
MYPTRFILLVILFIAVGQFSSSFAAPETPSLQERAGARRLLIVPHSVFDIEFGAVRLRSMDELHRALQTRVDANPKLGVTVVSSANADLGLTVLVLDACRKAGVRDITVQAKDPEPGAK